ncbi:hypothetical protein ACFSW8_17035 [Rubritalea tangerina]|uniref:ASCH domain-containing protein n=1 Tax=Rubritalea tangerina TaxID=430798 RepID=A0ABW4ZFB0_9BACT
MKRSILLSIHPTHVKNILNGSKFFEYRRVIPKEEVSHVVIYSTAPVSRVVAIARIEEIISESPSNTWRLTKSGAGIGKVFYDSYFTGRNIANALKLSNIVELEEPLRLNAIGESMKPPQSFCYVEAHTISDLMAARV